MNILEKIARKNGLLSSFQSSFSCKAQLFALFNSANYRSTLILTPVGSTQVWFLLSAAYDVNEMFMAVLLKRAKHGADSNKTAYMTMFSSS